MDLLYLLYNLTLSVCTRCRLWMLSILFRTIFNSFKSKIWRNILLSMFPIFPFNIKICQLMSNVIRSQENFFLIVFHQAAIIVTDSDYKDTRTLCYVQSTSFSTLWECKRSKEPSLILNAQKYIHSKYVVPA